MLTDQQIKSVATKKEKTRVFKDMNPPQWIYAQCSDGLWRRTSWQLPGGKFGWYKWEKV